MRKELVELHGAVFLFGFAGLFGKIISLPAMMIVLGRVVFAAIFLFLVMIYRKEGFKVPKRDLLYLPVLGLLLAVHWSLFFYSIQLSTVAIGLITYSTFPIFTAVLEPLIFKEKIRKMNVVLPIITFIGILFIVPNLNVQNNITQGIIWGILSGLTFSFLTIINRKYVQEYSSVTLAFYQDSFAAIFLLPILFLFKVSPSFSDIAYVVLLGIVFTGLAHTLFISSLRGVNARTASIIASLEPLYGIILAFIFLNEIPAIHTAIGGAIVLATSFYATLNLTKFK